MRYIKEIGTGAFRPGNDIDGSINASPEMLGPTTNADTTFSRRMQMTYEEVEEEEDITECVVFRKGKYCLLETLSRIKEFSYAQDVNALDRKLSQSANARIQKIDQLEDLEDMIDEANIDEFSGVGAIGGGPAVPIGYTAKGKPETPAQRRKRQRFNIEKSYPYTKLANPPRSTKKSRKK